MWRTKKDPDELNISEWKDVVLSLSDLFEKTGEIILTGGEPLLKKGVLDLVSFCKEKGLKTIMTSNAFLINEKMAKQISDSGLDQISISLDSYIEETHDFLRGVKGSYNRAVNSIEYIKKCNSNIRIEIITVLSGINLKEMPGHARWVKEHGKIDSLYFQAIACPFFSLSGNDWYNDDEFNFLWPKNIMEMYMIIDELIRLKKVGYPISNQASQLELFKLYFKNPNKRIIERKCYLGDFVININKTGDIFLCCFDKPIGNAKKDDIKNLWYSEQAEDLRTKMHRCDSACNNIVNCFFKQDSE
jgi:MoaA/NifB/PqqE/SkfB family radical SAM enzyme